MHHAASPLAASALAQPAAVGARLLSCRAHVGVHAVRRTRWPVSSRRPPWRPAVQYTQAELGRMRARVRLLRLRMHLHGAKLRAAGKRRLRAVPPDQVLRGGRPPCHQGCELCQPSAKRAAASLETTPLSSSGATLTSRTASSFAARGKLAAVRQRRDMRGQRLHHAELGRRVRKRDADHSGELSFGLRRRLGPHISKMLHERKWLVLL